MTDLLKELESVLVTLNRIDTFLLDGPDHNRLSRAKRALQQQIEWLRQTNQEAA